MRTLLSTGLCAGTLLLALAMPSRAMDSQARNVGFGTISVADRVSGTEMPGYVFYPMDRLDEEAATWRGPYEVHATPDAPPAPGDAWAPHRAGSTRDAHYALYRFRGRPGAGAATLAAGSGTGGATGR